MDKFGNNIPKLFPNRNSIFLKANPKEILFDGVKLTCNEKKFPELSTICKTLKALRSPVLKEGEKDGVYYLSIFQRVKSYFYLSKLIRFLKNFMKFSKNFLNDKY